MTPLISIPPVAPLATSDYLYNKEIQKQIDNGGKSNYCFACKKEQANMNQHKQSKIHEKNSKICKFLIEGVTITEESFRILLSKSEWLNDDIIMAYLVSLKFTSTMIMPYHYITYILEDQNYDRINQCLRQNIHNYNYLCGVMSLMNGKHWSAVLINMKTSVFYFIDPLGTSQDTVNKYFKSWVQYYNNRKDALLTRKWSNILVQQPIQQDFYNCAVYSCLFIQQLINNGSVSTIQQDMYLIRQQMAASIAFYKSFEMNVL